MSTGQALWSLLAIPSLLLLSSVGMRVVARARYSNPDLAARLDRMLVDVGGQHGFDVWVHSRTRVAWGVAFRRRGRPTVIAATDFVADASDEQLRGVPALQHAMLRDPDLTDLSQPSLLLVMIIGAACGVIAALLVHGTLRYASGWATVGLIVWLSQLSTAMRMRAALLGGGYERMDKAAAALAGDAAIVAAALQRMSDWRQPDHALGMRVLTLLARLTLPVPMRSAADVRAARLLERQ